MFKEEAYDPEWDLIPSRNHNPVRPKNKRMYVRVKRLLEEREGAEADRQWEIDDELDEIEQEIGIDQYDDIINELEG